MVRRAKNTTKNKGSKTSPKKTIAKKKAASPAKKDADLGTPSKNTRRQNPGGMTKKEKEKLKKLEESTSTPSPKQKPKKRQSQLTSKTISREAEKKKGSSDLKPYLNDLSK